MKKKIGVIAALCACVVLVILVVLPEKVTPPKNLGSIRLNIETYLAGENQPTHPSAVFFPEGWNGAKYWLAYSPYPYADGEEENPCLAVSNDMLRWETPPGLANPIADNEETGCNELKDPHLLYRADENRLEMWYLGRLSENLGGDGVSLLLMRKYSYDGINWEDYEVMTAVKYLSPTILWDGTKYQMWSIGYDLWGTSGTIVYQESEDGYIWSAPVRCVLGDKETELDVWHGSVTEHEGKFYFVFIDESDKQEIYCCESLDGIHYTHPRIIVENAGYWKSLYRPAVIFAGEKMYCLYGVITHAGQWFISMSTGPNENDLIGIREDDAVKMYPLKDEMLNTQTLPYRVKKLYNLVQSYVRLELLIIVAFELLALFLSKKIRNNKFLLYSMWANLLISIAYLAMRICPAGDLEWLGAGIALLGMNIAAAAVLQCTVTILERSGEH